MSKEKWLGLLLCLMFCCMLPLYSCNVIQAEETKTNTKENVEEVKPTEEVKNYCGTSATWTYNENTNVLTIKGKGTIEFDKRWNDLKYTRVVIGEGITRLSDNLFRYKSQLQSVKLPSTLKVIPRQAFNGCSSLKTINFPKNLTNLGSYAFHNTAIKSATVPTTVTTMGYNVFSECRYLERVDFGMSYVPSSTFSGCKKLNTITFRKKITSIENSAFNRTGFTKFTIPSTVTRVGSYAFSDSKNLTQITFPKSLTTIEERVVMDCSKLKKVIIENGVKVIKPYAFSGTYMQSISIPESVEKIGSYAFSDVTGLKSIKIPNKITIIYHDTFNNCKSLETLTFGKNVKKIGESAFEGCQKLTKLVIPGNIKTIDYKAFYNSGVKELVLKEGVQKVEYWAFANCNKLTSVDISSTVSTIRENSFVECPKLGRISVHPINKTYRSENGVLYSKSMRELIICPAGKSGKFVIPASVDTLNENSFYNCKKLTSFEVASGNRYFTSKNGMIFANNQKTLVACPSGKTGVIVVPEGTKAIGDYAFQHSQASRIKLPESLTKIGSCAFEYAANIKKVIIPGNVRTISAAAFWQCPSLNTVEIRNGVVNINRFAFYECPKLKKVSIPMSVGYINNNAFQGSYNVTIYCNKISYAMTYAKKHYMEYKIV